MKEERKLSRHSVAAVATAGLSMSVAENLLDMKHTLNPSSQLDLNKELVCLFVCPSIYLMQSTKMKLVLSMESKVLVSNLNTS